MRLSTALFQVFRFLLVPALLFTTYLYLYPAFHGCSFPPAKQAETACYQDGTKGLPEQVAPFRLLAFGDPQIEGDSSLPNPNDPKFPSLAELRSQLSISSVANAPSTIIVALNKLVTHDLKRLLKGYRKRLDLFGNDLYLAHVYRSVSWWSDPTHTVVLGDLLGSQWIGDEEFARRSRRFWNIFKGQERVPDHVSATGELDDTQQLFLRGRLEALDDPAISKWKKYVINVAGNHDIGYAGDIDERRIARFERAFGKVNWETRFQLSSNYSGPASSVISELAARSPRLRLIMLNTMNLDLPAWQLSPQEDTHGFLVKEMERIQGQDRQEDATILLTHIPLFKDGGVCTDGPFFTYFPPEQGGGIMEQNHLTNGSSESILDGLFPMPRSEGGSPNRGVILNGHDHEGCDTYHYQLPEGTVPDKQPPSAIGRWSTTQYWWARRSVQGKEAHGIREVTVRSMMGSYGGNVGLLSAWFDSDAGHWKFEYNGCIFGVQHIWWAVHILDLIVVLLGLASLLAALTEARSDQLQTCQTLASSEVVKKNQ